MRISITTNKTFKKILYKNKKSFFIVFLLSIILFSPFSIFLSQHQYVYAQSTGMSYPANIDYEGILGYGNYTPAALANPNIGALDISMNWNQVEPAQGVFNFAPADQTMHDWATAGKRFTLIVRYVKELEGNFSCSSSQQLLPQWEAARIKTLCDTDHNILIPDYFDPTFQADLKAYVQAIANHIQQSPYKNNLLYVRVAVGLGGEGFPYFQQGDDKTVDLPQLEKWGYTPAAFQTFQQQMMTAFKQSFSFTTVIFPLNGYGTDTATGKPFFEENAEWAGQQGLGIGQQGLKPQTNYPVFPQLRSQYPTMYMQFQTGYSSGNADVAGDVQAAEKNGVQFVEWFTADILKSSNQQYFQAWQQYVNNKFGMMSNSRNSNPSTGLAVAAPTTVQLSQSGKPLPTPPPGCYYHYVQPTGFFSRIKTFFAGFLCSLGLHSFCQQPALICSDQQSNTFPVQLTQTQSITQQPKIHQTCQQRGGFCSARVVNGKFCAPGRHVTTTGSCQSNFHCCIPDAIQ